MYCYVRPLEKVLHHVWLEGPQWLPIMRQEKHITANKTVDQISTHRAIANSINHFQVIVVDEKLIALRRTLRISSYDRRVYAA